MCRSENYILIDIPLQNDAGPAIHSAFPKIDNLEYFPEKVLLHIFSHVNDADLLKLSDCSYRFGCIAKVAFKRRYANKYFVFDSEKKSKRKMYWELFERFGHYAEIRAVEVNYIENMDDLDHWLPQLLHQYVTHLEKLTLHKCWCKGINEILSHHTHITHLTVRQSVWNGQLILPNYRNLKKFEIIDNHLSGFIAGKTIEAVMRNNPSLEVLNLSHCGPIISIYCIAQHLKHLKELNLIISMRDDWEFSDENMDFVADSLEHLESLRLTIHSYGYIELIRRLSVKCNQLKLLELDQNVYNARHANSGDEIIEAAARFEAIESLELSHLKSYNSINTLDRCLPNMHRLRDLKLFINTPQRSNAFISSLSSKSSSLKTITITAWNDATFSWPKFLISTAIFKEMIRIIFGPSSCKVELKEFHDNFGFATNKEIILSKEQTHWIVNDSIVFSFKLVLSIQIFLFIFVYASLSFIGYGFYSSRK